MDQGKPRKIHRLIDWWDTGQTISKLENKLKRSLYLRTVRRLGGDEALTD